MVKKNVNMIVLRSVFITSIHKFLLLSVYECASKPCHDNKETFY